MIRKSIILALAAAATFGVSMLTTSTADARGFGPGAHSSFSRSSSFSRGPSFARFNHFRPNFAFNHHHYRHWYPRVWYRPIYTGYTGYTGYASYSAPAAAAPAANTCNCLTKQYTQDASGANIVVFKDVCTGELAMNPPAQQAPVQQSQYAPQQQAMPQYAPQPQMVPQYAPQAPQSYIPTVQR